MIAGLLHRALAPVVRTGALTFTFADGQSFTLGDGAGDPVKARFTDARAPWALLLDPDLRMGELFTDGRLVIDQGDVYGMLHILLRHGDESEPSWWGRRLEALREGLIRVGRGNDLRRARRNVSRHYDLDDRLYALFLDPQWQYSCAYFEQPGQSLADAQMAKMRHVAAKLALQGGERVLDIGCGWGGLACHLAATAGAGEVLGVTLSGEQIGRARERAARHGLDDRVAFEQQDYRAVAGRFDRIVSVGMFEHVGRRWYDTFFKTCQARLADDGVMLLHTIGVSDAPSLTNPWITRYIFPGGHLPALSEIVPAIERAGLMITDVEVLRLHYAETLRAWRDAFMARRDEARALFDERFCRMWEYYLAMSETAFRCEGVVVFQIQLARRVDALPMTRNYIAATERALAMIQAPGSASGARLPALA
jgi:cyclopropane-fatty-acyl-phospholipid synthase